MRKVILLSLIIASIIGSCTQAKKSSIEGAWKIVEYGQWHITDTSLKAMFNNG
jgi:hypothetical protein